jgi:hypothetical protein
LVRIDKKNGENMKKPILWFVGGLTLTLLAGCGALRGPEATASVFDRNGTDVVVDHQNGIAYHITPATALEKVCRSPAPDVVVGTSAAVSESMPLKALGGEQASVSSQFDAVNLGGRNPAVLIVREIFYRGCELAINHDLSAEQSLALFRETLDRTVQIAQIPMQSPGTVAAISAGAATAAPLQPMPTAPLAAAVQSGADAVSATPSPTNGTGGSGDGSDPSAFPSTFPSN